MEVIDDGRIRTGTLWTATAHAITSILGSGVLALPWSVAQLGWILGPTVLILFALVTYYTAILLSDCYRSPDPVSGARNYTYKDAVKSFLGEKNVIICGVIQYTSLWGAMVGYTITATMSMMAIHQSNCFHKKGHTELCRVSGTLYFIIFGIMEVALSQLPNLEKISFLSYIATATSFTYSLIGLYLCLAQLISHHKFKGTIVGVESRSISAYGKIWYSFQALGNIAFAYTFSLLLIEIQDTLKSPPSENKTMRKVSIYSIGVTTIFYISLGCMGYAAFGNNAPGNILTGFYEPFWLVDIVNLTLLIHLVGAYQVFAQPLFSFYEQWLAVKWSNVSFFHRVYTLQILFSKSRQLKFTLCKLILRTLFILLTTVVAMLLPFFNAVVGLLGSIGFWPLTVYFPVSMYITQAKIKRGTMKWFILQTMSLACLIVSIVASVGSVADVVERLKTAKLFEIEL